MTIQDIERGMGLLFDRIIDKFGKEMPIQNMMELVKVHDELLEELNQRFLNKAMGSHIGHEFPRESMSNSHNKQWGTVAMPKRNLELVVNHG